MILYRTIKNDDSTLFFPLTCARLAETSRTAHESAEPRIDAWYRRYVDSDLELTQASASPFGRLLARVESAGLVIGGGLAALLAIAFLISGDLHTAAFMGAIVVAAAIGFIPTLLRKFVEK